MRIAIVVGHNARAQGAVRVTDRASEYVWNGDLADRIKRRGKSTVKVFRRTSGPGEISRVYREVAAWKADCAVELHFNAFASASAHGCETLYGSTPGSMTLAELVQRGMVGALGNHDRGLIRRLSGNGATAINQRAQPTVLIEPYFGSNPDECRLADDRKDALAAAILTAARQYLGAGAVEPEAPETDEAARINAALGAIANAAADALSTGWAADLSDDVKRNRWTLETIRRMASQET